MEGYYRNATSDACVECDESLVCTDFNLAMGDVPVSDGYFVIRRSEVTSLVYTAQCPPDACVNSSCAVGFEGFLCSTCSAGYYHMGEAKDEAECKTCEPSFGKDWLNQGSTVMSIAVGLMMIGYQIWLSIKTPPPDLEEKAKDEATKMDEKLDAMETRDGVVTKVVVNYLQVLSIVGNFDIEWLDFIKSMFAFSSTISSAGGISFGGGAKCVLYSGSIPLPMNELIVHLINFAIHWLAILCFWYTFTLVKRGKFSSTARSEAIMVSFVVLGYNNYPDFLVQLFQLFKCSTFPGESFPRLQGASDVKCYEGDHLKWIFVLGLPVCFGIVLGFPLSALWKLRKEHRRNQLQSRRVQAQIGFLCDGYRPALYFWDIFTCLRNFCLSAIIVFISVNPDAPYQQGLAALAVFIFCISIHLAYSPYENPELNSLEGLGLFASLSTLYLGIWTFSLEGIGKMMVSVLIIIINGLWLVRVGQLQIALKAVKMKRLSKKLSGLASKRLSFFVGKAKVGIKTEKGEDVVNVLQSNPQSKYTDAGEEGEK
jgi:hypothetical protein